MFKIKLKNNKTIKISEKQLFENILNEALQDINNPKLKDSNNYIKTIYNITSSHNLEGSLLQLFNIFFLAGYYYKIFLEKNDIEFNKTKENKN